MVGFECFEQGIEIVVSIAGARASVDIVLDVLGAMPTPTLIIDLATGL